MRTLCTKYVHLGFQGLFFHSCRCVTGEFAARTGEVKETAVIQRRKVTLRTVAGLPIMTLNPLTSTPSAGMVSFRHITLKANALSNNKPSVCFLCCKQDLTDASL